MSRVAVFWRVLLASVLVVVGSGGARANIWMDEHFEGTPFVQGDSKGGVPNATLDLASYPQITTTGTITASPLTHTGSRVNTKAFDGAYSYRLEPGQVLSVGREYMNATNNNIQLFQFAANVDPIPPPGTVGELRWNIDMDRGSPTGGRNSFFVRFVSNGTIINIEGGEDTAHSPAMAGRIGTIDGPGKWVYVTLLLQTNLGKVRDSRPPFRALGELSRGMHFFVSSTGEKLFVPAVGPGVEGFIARDWQFTVQSGTLYLDSIYWDSGMEGGGIASPEYISQSRPRFLDSGAPCTQVSAAPVSAAAVVPSQNSIAWRTSIASVVSEARNGSKRILVFFHSPGAMNSEHINSKVLSDPRVISLVNSNLIPLRINMHEQSSLAARLGVFRGGIIVIYGANGVALKMLTMVPSAQELLDSLR